MGTGFYEEEKMKCPICKIGETEQGNTTVTLTRDDFTLVVKEVPARICTNCGEDYIDSIVVRELLELAERMAKNGSLVDIRKYMPGMAAPC
jgi:YgiT-type zinc finger domain-containing protein